MPSAYAFEFIDWVELGDYMPRKWGCYTINVTPFDMKGISVIKLIGSKNNKAPDDKSWVSLRWSERRGSNSRHPPWQGGALPAELLSHNFNYFKQ